MQCFIIRTSQHQIAHRFNNPQAHVRASQCLQCTGLLHAPPKSVQGDIGLADKHKQGQLVHCTPKLMYKKIDTQRNTKISEPPRCPTMASHLVSGASCVPCVEKQTLGKTRLHKRSSSNHCPMPKKKSCTKMYKTPAQKFAYKKKQKTFQKTLKQQKQHRNICCGPTGCNNP